MLFINNITSFCFQNKDALLYTCFLRSLRCKKNLPYKKINSSIILVQTTGICSECLFLFSMKSKKGYNYLVLLIAGLSGRRLILLKFSLSKMIHEHLHILLRIHNILPTMWCVFRYIILLILCKPICHNLA